MIQRVVKNGKVRAFGYGWTLDGNALAACSEGSTVRVRRGGRFTVWLYLLDGNDELRCVGSAFRGLKIVAAPVADG